MSANSESRSFERFDDLAEEFAARFRRGERPNLQEFIDRAPDLADEIRELFPMLEMMERSGSDAGVDLWDSAAGRHRDRFSAHIDILRTLAFSPDGTLLGAGGHLGFVSVWALARRERVFLFKGPAGSRVGLGPVRRSRRSAGRRARQPRGERLRRP